MADLKIVPVTSRSSRAIENKILELLKFVRENEVYHVAFVATCDDENDPTLMAYHKDFADSEQYEMDSLIIGVDDLLETLDDMYYYSIEDDDE